MAYSSNPGSMKSVGKKRPGYISSSSHNEPQSTSLAPLLKISFFTYTGVWALLRRVWTRFYSAKPPHALFLELKEYLAKHRCISGLLKLVSNPETSRVEGVSFLLDIALS